MNQIICKSRVSDVDTFDALLAIGKGMRAAEQLGAILCGCTDFTEKQIVEVLVSKGLYPSIPGFPLPGSLRRALARKSERAVISYKDAELNPVPENSENAQTYWVYKVGKGETAVLGSVPEYLCRGVEAVCAAARRKKAISPKPPETEEQAEERRLEREKTKTEADSPGTWEEKAERAILQQQQAIESLSSQRDEILRKSASLVEKLKKFQAEKDLSDALRKKFNLLINEAEKIKGESLV